MIRVVHYINQFFGQIGGEEKANITPEVREGIVGPGLAFKTAFKGEAEIVATVICGDSYYNENEAKAKAEILEMIKKYNPDIFIAGPAFNAGRYGTACGSIAKEVQEVLHIPVLSGMYIENPGADMFKKEMYIVSTKDNAAGMRDAVPKMASFALKLVNGETLGTPEAEGYIERGIRKNYFSEDRGSKRAVEMLVKKITGEKFVTEFKMPDFDRVEPNAPILDITKCKVAIVTSGGIVPKGNPDRIESSSASKYGKYSIEGIDDLTPENSETAHGGHDPVYANADADRVIPVDILREFEREGKIGSLHNFYYSTTGNGTAVASARKFGTEIAADLIAAGVDAVILTST
jgi:glycine reductase complex component B subunit gamma